MKPTPSQEEEITVWFKDKFWPNYPAKFCGRGKGSRGTALKKMLTYVPDEDERERILGNLKAQVRAHSQKHEGQRNYWKIGETYVNNKLWDDEIESSMEIKEKQQLKTCCIENCNNDVHGERFKYCSTHIPSAHSEAMKSAWIRTGIDMKSPTLTADCRSHCRTRLNILLGRTA